jgi:hypothetical protein
VTTDPIERRARRAGAIDILDRILDQGIVLDAWLRLSTGGIDLIGLHARLLVASSETCLQHSLVVAEAGADCSGR